MLASETGIESVTPSISFSQFCLKKLHEVIDGHTNDVAGLRLQIMRRTPEGFQHVLSMVEDGAQDKIPDDLVVSIENIKVYVPIKDAKYLDGLKVDFEEQDEGQSGLEFINPNPRWFDDREEAIQQLFDDQINPAIAGHGGMVNLLGVDGEDAYVEFSGGCQGCGQANVTLGQGIETAVKRFVPGIDRMVDVTNHAEGTHPYFKPSQASHAHAGGSCGCSPDAGCGCGAQH